MKLLLKKFKELYRKEKLEIQYAIAIDSNNQWHIRNISTHNTTDSSITNFYELSVLLESLGESLKELYIVHNHPNNWPEPSNIDFRNEELIAIFVSNLGFRLSDYLIYSKCGYFSFFEADYLSDYLTTAKKINTIFSSLHIKDLDDINKIKSQICSFMLYFNVLFIGFAKNVNYLLSPLEFRSFKEENTYVKSSIFIKREVANTKTIKFLKALYPSDMLFIYAEESQFELIV